MKDLQALCAEKLKGFADQLTATDKKEITKKTGISRTTIDKYLTGDVSNLDMAEKLITVCGQRVDRRIRAVMGI